MNNRLFQILIVLCVVLMQSNVDAQVQFNHEFAPHEGLIKDLEKPQRDEICLNGTWQFMPVHLPEGVTLEQIKSPELPSTSNWEQTPYKVPSPWNVNGFETNGGGDFRSFPSYPEEWNNVKSGWIRKTVKVPANWNDNRVILHFEAVAGYAKVFVNGNEIGDHFDSFLPFSFDVTEHVKPGEEADVLVWVAHGSLLNDPGKYGRRNYVAGSFWGIYIAGIWQDVYLQKLPNVYVSETFIKPWVDKDELEVEFTVKNTTEKAAKVNINANIYQWINKNGKSVSDIPETNWTLGNKSLALEQEKSVVEANASRTFVLKTKVNGALELWSNKNPNLYGLVLSVNNKKQVVDTDYTRFGWRQFKIDGTQFLLNGEPFQVKGDSWHFMGVPQMTRRYAYAWYQMLLDANGNGLRLHAQIFPRFYLEMADEMGISVLAETGIWSSDGGPKVDSELYWQACRDHIAGMIHRDRNHPSVLGWSVCNETLPVTKHVFNAPQELVDKNISEINKWVQIARDNDPTRTWISGDGETQAQTDLPTVIGHYGDENAVNVWSSQGKPWGIGETGMAYFGTPAQVARVNGDRAYESQLGRMEGIAGEAFELIKEQRNLDAAYTSVFNVAWYGLRPLPFGLKDTSRPYTLEDGVYFNDYTEGKPGYQPERIGAYASTFNPGYDPSLPLYQPWPMFEAVKLAFSDEYNSVENKWGVKQSNLVDLPEVKRKEGVVCLSGDDESTLATNLTMLGIQFEKLNSRKNQLIIIDGQNGPMVTNNLVEGLRLATQKGSTIIFWNANETSSPLINAISHGEVVFEARDATSYVIMKEHPVVNKQSNASLYFSELSKTPVSTYTISGDWSYEGQEILAACNTDWHKWNYQGEPVKTAKVYMDELAAKPSATVIGRQKVNRGEVIISTLHLSMKLQSMRTLMTQIFDNLGATFDGEVKYIPVALNDEGELVNAFAWGSHYNETRSIKHVFENQPLTEEEFTKVTFGSEIAGKEWIVASAGNHAIWNFAWLNFTPKEYGTSYLSFWLYSPRSLTDLLIEPNIPHLDMHFQCDDALSFSINGKIIKEYLTTGSLNDNKFIYEGLPLEKGWNHFLIKVGQNVGDWQAKVKFTSNDPEFMKQLKSTVVK
jgi:beta-galactosidase